MLIYLSENNCQLRRKEKKNEGKIVVKVSKDARKEEKEKGGGGCVSEVKASWTTIVDFAGSSFLGTYLLCHRTTKAIFFFL